MTVPAPLARGLAVVAAATSAILLTGCGATSGPSAAASSASTSLPASASRPVVQVVASTNVWGDVVKSVGGERVSVVSFISDPSQDPHSYEANAQNQLAIKQAGLVVENGGGYDDFMDTMINAGGGSARVLNAVDISGKTAPAGGDLNEHVWYDLPTVGKVAGQVATALGALDPAGAGTFTTNANAFADSLKPLDAALGAIQAAHAGAGVAITEPVPVYLLDAAGLHDKTPQEFTKAVEEGSDVSPAVLNQTLMLFSDKQVKALVYNEQTTGPTTEAVKNAAAEANIPVVPVTETLPGGKTYLSWMSTQIAALTQALGS